MSFLSIQGKGCPSKSCSVLTVSSEIESAHAAKNLRAEKECVVNDVG